MKTTARPIELYTPSDLEPYIATTRAAIDASHVANDPSWLTTLRDTIHRRLAFAIAATKHGGIIPGSVPPPQKVTVGASRPLHGTSRFFSEVDAKVGTRYEGSTPAQYDASEEARDSFAAEVEALAADILASPQRSFDVHCHFLALDLAADAKRAAEAERAERESIARAFTDPLTGVCNPAHGTIAHRSVIGEKTWDKAGAWHYVESSPVTALLIQHRIAARILEQHPELAKSIDDTVSRMMRDAGL